jgi:multidrug transporter EmrE-like cation transporter
MKNQITQTIVIFVALAIIFAVLATIGKGMADSFTQNLLIGTGAVILGSGLTFFLLRMTQLQK